MSLEAPQCVDAHRAVYYTSCDNFHPIELQCSRPCFLELIFKAVLIYQQKKPARLSLRLSIAKRRFKSMQLAQVRFPESEIFRRNKLGSLSWMLEYAHPWASLREESTMLRYYCWLAKKLNLRRAFSSMFFYQHTYTSDLASHQKHSEFDTMGEEADNLQTSFAM